MEVYLIRLARESPTARVSLIAMNYLIKFPSVSHCLGSGQNFLFIVLHISICEFSCKVTELTLQTNRKSSSKAVIQL